MAGVIKREVPTQTSAFSLRDVRAQCDAMLSEARARAAAMIRQAEADAREHVALLERTARQRGHDEGRKAGLASVSKEARAETLSAAKDELTRLIEALAAAMGEFEENKRRMLAAAETGVIDVALAVARRVCKALPEISCDAARGNVRHVLEMIGHEHDVELRLHPDDAQALEAAMADMAVKLPRTGHTRLIADAGVARGGCVLSARTCTIDAGIGTQLDRVAEALLAGHRVAGEVGFGAGGVEEAAPIGGQARSLTVAVRAEGTPAEDGGGGAA